MHLSHSNINFAIIKYTYRRYCNHPVGYDIIKSLNPSNNSSIGKDIYLPNAIMTIPNTMAMKITNNILPPDIKLKSLLAITANISLNVNAFVVILFPEYS